jgi:transposase
MADDRQTFTAIVFVLTTGCAWRHLPPTFGVSHQPRTDASPNGPKPQPERGIPPPCARFGATGISGLVISHNHPAPGVC